MYIHGILQSRRDGRGARLARSPATNFSAARIVTFASLIALCENQASHVALQRFSARRGSIALKMLEACRNPDRAHRASPLWQRGDGTGAGSAGMKLSKACLMDEPAKRAAPLAIA
jgi:hypothetical protein